mmetsp:Transcript_1838/g.3699  ORF Transcript_1838/g.3699 Transcript_1838/m.3699 type:complete len:235 (-) Transcript_1838:324-1028(-)
MVSILLACVITMVAFSSCSTQYALVLFYSIHPAFVRVTQDSAISGSLFILIAMALPSCSSFPHMAPATCGGHWVGRRSSDMFLFGLDLGAPISWVRLFGFLYSLVRRHILSFLFAPIPQFSTAHGTRFMWGSEAFRCSSAHFIFHACRWAHLCWAVCTSPSCCHSLASFHRSHSVTIAFSSWSCLHLHAFLCLRFRCIAHSSFSFALSSNPLLLLHARLGTRAFNPNFKCGFFC